MLLAKLNTPLIASNLVKSSEISASNFYSCSSSGGLFCQWAKVWMTGTAS